MAMIDIYSVNHKREDEISVSYGTPYGDFEEIIDVVELYVWAKEEGLILTEREFTLWMKHEMDWSHLQKFLVSKLSLV